MCRWQIGDRRERGKNAEMENRNQHMRKTGAMRGVAAEPAQQQHDVALRHASAPAAAASAGKQRRARKRIKKPENPLKKEPKCCAASAALEMAKSLRIALWCRVSTCVCVCVCASVELRVCVCVCVFVWGMQKEDEQNTELKWQTYFHLPTQPEGRENSLEKAAQKAKAKLQIYNIRLHRWGEQRGEWQRGGREVAEVALDLNCLLMFSVLPCGWEGRQDLSTHHMPCQFQPELPVEVVFQVEVGE